MKPVRYAVAWLLCAAALAMVGCTGTLDAAVRGKGAISQSLDQAVVAWKSYDEAKQLRLANEAPTKEAAHAALDAYRAGEQAKVVKAINGTWAALVGVDKALAVYQAGDKGGLSAAILTAYASLSEVVQALTLAGVPLAGVLK